MKKKFYKTSLYVALIEIKLALYANTSRYRQVASVKSLVFIGLYMNQEFLAWLNFANSKKYGFGVLKLD